MTVGYSNENMQSKSEVVMEKCGKTRLIKVLKTVKV